MLRVDAKTTWTETYDVLKCARDEAVLAKDETWTETYDVLKLQFNNIDI